MIDFVIPGKESNVSDGRKVLNINRNRSYQTLVNAFNSKDVGNLLTKYPNYKTLGKNSKPQDLIKSLERQGWTKEIQPGGKKSGPATIFTDPKTGTKIRIHATLGEGTSYFRVQNKGGNYLDGTGAFPSNATKKELRDLTHFYFGK